MPQISPVNWMFLIFFLIFIMKVVEVSVPIFFFDTKKKAKMSNLKKKMQW